MSDALDERTTHLILVHGTWGRGFFKRAIKPTVIISKDIVAGAPAEEVGKQQRLRWFEPGAEFRAQLAGGLREARLDFTTRLLLWNGRNSIESRNEAARVLADLIGKLAAEQPDDAIVIIAHSHGGNIALQAVDIAGTNGGRHLKVITLATPFVQVHAPTATEQSGHDIAGKKGDAALDLMRRSWMAVLGAPFLIGLMFLAVTYQDAMRTLLQPTAPIDPFVIATIVIVAVGLLLGYRLSKGPIKLVANPRPISSIDQGQRGAGADEWTSRPERLAMLSRYVLPSAGKDWLLVLRGIDDEASLTLAAGAIGNRVAHFMLGGVLPAIQEALALICGLVVLAALAGSFWDTANLVVFPVIAFGFAGVAVLSVVIFFLPGIFRSVYGRELLLGSWRCEIAANSSPDSTDGVQVTTLLTQPGASKRGLRHALYMNAEAPGCILKWLQSGARRDTRR